MSYRFNPPPSWPRPPHGWQPPAGWEPDPSWPEPPPGWQLWIPEQTPPADGAPAPSASAPLPPPTPGAEEGGVAGTYGRRGKQVEAEVHSLTAELEQVRSAYERARAKSAALHRRLVQVQGMEAADLVVETERLRADAELVDELLLEKCERASQQLQQSLAHDRRLHDDLQCRMDRLDVQLAQGHRDLERLREQVVHTEDTAMLQEAGVYEYRHPLADAVAHQRELEVLKGRIRTLARGGGAVRAATDWHVNGSLAEGRRMVRDFSTLMLRAYNAEAESAVRTMRPHRLDSMTERLEKSRQTVARLGATMHIRISDDYHRLRVRELELTADHLAKQEEERERRRELRERRRDEERLRGEIARGRARLDEERRDRRAALERLRASASGDEPSLAEVEAGLAGVEEAMAALDAREADLRAGYLYVVSNVGAFGERMVKIGMTRRLEPMDRVDELGDAAVPFRFDVHALVFSEDAVGLKRALHEEFEDHRVNRVDPRREFFHVTPAEVRSALEHHVRQGLLEFREDPEASEWRASEAAARAAA